MNRLPPRLSSTSRKGAYAGVRRRMLLVIGILGMASAGLVVRAFELQVLRKDFYQNQGHARFLRVVPMAVSRGTIFDRNGEPLAVSTPMVSITCVPSEVLDNAERIPALARALGIDPQALKSYLAQRADHDFAYLRREMNPDDAQAVLALGIAGVNAQREYKRYYPSGEVMAHVLGFTNIDDHGQEGLELAFDDWLAGKPGAKRIIRDRMGHIVEDLEQVRAPQPGQDLTLSIDRRIQFLAYRELKKQLQDLDADAGEMVVLDVRTGEILAMVSFPTYNPNVIAASTPAARRNRCVTDVVEPGSTMKPFTMAAGLSSGKYTPAAPLVDTGNGHWWFMGKDIRDVESGGNGLLTPTGVLTKSSNIGAAKISLSLDTKFVYDTYRAFGFGASTGSGFPGESSGFLRPPRSWRPIEKATMAYGYGLNVTLLQLAVAYATLADHGVMHTPTFIKGGGEAGKQVISPVIARELLEMLKTVTAPGGSATRAQIANYIVAGKTGTAHLAAGGGYARDNYNSLFAGIVPVTEPRLVGVVVVNNPKKNVYFGGIVSAPVFPRVMTGALRLLDIPPDNIGRWYAGGPLKAGGGLAGTVPPSDRQADQSTVEAVEP